jgi:sugar lactone lactonase YvrE
MTPEAIAIDTNGDVYVADTMNDRIQMFDNQFKFQFVKIGR